MSRETIVLRTSRGQNIIHFWVTVAQLMELNPSNFKGSCVVERPPGIAPRSRPPACPVSDFLVETTSPRASPLLSHPDTGGTGSKVKEEAPTPPASTLGIVRGNACTSLLFWPSSIYMFQTMKTSTQIPHNIRKEDASSRRHQHVQRLRKKKKT